MYLKVKLGPSWKKYTENIYQKVEEYLRASLRMTCLKEENWFIQMGIGM